MYQRTTATTKIQALNKRIKAVAGGTSASKTISILLLLIDYAQSTPGKIISVTSESYPHLKRGAMRDFLNIMEGHHYFRNDLWNKTDSFYTFETGSIIEFFGVESWEKVKGARRDVLFINEANHVSYNAFTQMEVRTKEDIYLDWNPEAEFWFYKYVLPRDDVDFITLTYLDNEALDKKIVKAIESRRNDIQWFKVYGLGQLGEVEGRIYTGWNVELDTIPHEAKLVRYGLDFGYSADQAALVAEYEYNGGTIFNELLYNKGMQNRDIAEFIKQQEKGLIIADSAEPKSIDEIASYIKPFGFNIVPSVKGKDSVLFGIQYLQSKKVSVTKTSLNLIDEYRSYLWMRDKEGEFIKEPSPIKNHLMDACRYSASSGQKLVEWKPNAPGGVNPYIPGTLI
jgi:phage terminase large subunit